VCNTGYKEKAIMQTVPNIQREGFTGRKEEQTPTVKRTDEVGALYVAVMARIDAYQDKMLEDEKPLHQTTYGGIYDKGLDAGMDKAKAILRSVYYATRRIQ
jgi:hypothetical protein